MRLTRRNEFFWQETHEPDITSSTMTLKSPNTIVELNKLGELKRQSAEQRAAMKRWLDQQMAQMEAQSRKIAEHRVETAGKFSLRG